MSLNQTKLRNLLAELFQLDQADLDFGIYRIMNTKRDEVLRFLDKDLLPQVQEAFKQYKSADKSVLQDELDKLEKSVRDAGMNPDESPKVKDLRQRLADSAVDVTALENEVFSHLFNFFRRYYSEGDFISQRRYKEGVYAIPYEGEEVKLHWANADQYYIKSSETFRDYTFKIAGGKRVRVHLVAASTEQDNNKAAQGKERRFVLADKPLSEENGELFIRFEYRPFEGKEKQDDLNRQAIEAVLKTPGFEHWAEELGKLAPTDKKKDRTVLEKHLTNYTARNTFDYFIHKDLGGFLRRELDFYIKNEVMHLDDIEHESAPKVEQYLSQIKVIRSIAHKIINFLEQLENFQKKLWLKKKFVIETNYCITLDRVPEELYPEIAANDGQREEWVKLFAIDDIKKDLNQPGYSKPLKPGFLSAHPMIMMDTRHFSAEFKSRLLAKLDSVDSHTSAVLVHSDNFHALSVLQGRYQGQIKCVYIDPPYNTDASPIIYKNGYRRSSWNALMANRIALDERLRTKPSVRCIAIDDFEYPDLQGVLESISSDVHHATSVVRSKPQGRPTASGFSANHEYAIFYGSPDAVIGRLPRSGSKAERYPHSDVQGIYSWANFRKSGTDSDRQDRPRSYYPLYVAGDVVRIPEMTWDDASKNWHVVTPLKKDEIAVWPVDAEKNEKVWTCAPDRAREEIVDIRVVNEGNDRVEIHKKYRPNQEGALPGTWWDDPGYSASESGTKVLKDMFGAKDFDYPKSINLVTDCLRVGNVTGGDYVLDYFAGSGTTGHAVIKLNREDAGKRKVILSEMGHYFDTVLLPRLKKVTFTPDWKDGKPVRFPTREEIERGPKIIKYIRLESYEDALNNLELKRTEQQSIILDADADTREQYLLSYMLDVESRGSQSLLNIEAFRNPDEYKLRIERNGETQLVDVDLVETFNWLLGLMVKHIDVIPFKKGGHERTGCPGN